MMRNAFFSTALVVGLFFTPSLQGLEIERGPVTLLLYEDIGRFNVRINGGNGTEKPFTFFVKEDPRTTQLQILVDNNIYTMGEQSGFRLTFQKTETGARYVWSSPLIRVTEEFVFLTAADSPLTEGVKILIKIENVSEEARTIGVRYLFDTWLGEKANTHFITSGGGMLARETSLSRQNADTYWISPNMESSRGDGLLVLTDPSFVTKPDDVVFANWKRLYESAWDYRPGTSNDFNYYPYSFNDSAVCQYYNAQRVNKGAAREIVIVLGNSSSYIVGKTTYVADATKGADGKNKLDELNARPTFDENTTEIAKSDTMPEKELPPTEGFSGGITKPLTKSNYDFVHNEMGRLDRLLDDINGSLGSKNPVSEEELRKLRTVIADVEIKARQK